jgi:thioredoxin:protein disulfide reductase
MKRTVLFCLLFVFAVACAGNESVPQTDNKSVKVEKTEQPNSAEAVKFSARKTRIKAGSSGEAILKLEIQPPFHVNANPPSDENLIPTSIEFEAKNGVTFEKPIYPAGKSKIFQFSDKPLAVYDDEVEIKLPVKTDAKVVKGEQTVTGKLRFQPCDEAVCYRPQTVAVVLIIEIS